MNSLPSKPWGDWVSSFFQNVDYVPAGDSNILQIELIGESSCVTVQRTPEPSPTADTDQDDGADSDDGPPVTMSVIKLDGESYPIEQMLPHGSVNGDCLDEHFHTPNGAIPTNPDAAPIADPRPGGCGIGTYDDIVDIEVSQSDWLVFQDRAVAARDGGSGSSQSGDTTETIGVDVVVVNGERFPIEQFDAPTRDACDNKEHYHSSLPSFSLEGGTLADPDPDGCGYATVDEVIHVQVPAEEWNRYRSLLAGT